MSFYGRLYPLPAQQQIGAPASANCKYRSNTGRSWVKRLSFQLNAYSRPKEDAQRKLLNVLNVLKIAVPGSHSDRQPTILLGPSG